MKRFLVAAFIAACFSVGALLGLASNGYAAVVSAAPLGPVAPAGGWAVEYANGFGACILGAPCTLTGAPVDNTIHPSSGKPANTSQEPDLYLPSQDVVTPAGLQLNCNYAPHVGGTTGTWPDYACGQVDQVSLQPNGSGDPAGYRLFHFSPGHGQVWAFQTVFQAPVNTGEMDPSPWYIGYHWAWEIDAPEMWGYQHIDSGWAGNMWGFPSIVRTNFGGAGGQRDFTFGKAPSAFDPSLALHTYTVEDNGDVYSSYLDGTLMAAGFTVGSPSSYSADMGGLRIQNSLRVAHLPHPADGNPDKYFESGTRTMLVRSTAVYENAAAHGAETVNAGIAPGTTVQ